MAWYEENGTPWLSLSTGSTPPEERGELWRRTLTRAYGALDTDVRRDARDWAASLTAYRTRTLRVAAEASGPVRLTRTAGAVAADGRTHLLARVQREGSAVLTQDGRTVRLTPGTLAFHDAGRPFGLALPEPQRALVLVLPRPLLRLGEPELRGITAMPLTPADDGPAGLLLPLFDGLAAQIGAASPSAREVLARTMTGLLGTLAAQLVGGAGRLRPPDGPTTPLERIKASALDRLGEPGLSPRALAAEHHISVRYLHKLFQAEGTTFGSWVRARRLAACRAELARPGAGDLVMAAVAARWGFPNPAHFSRVFRRAYGMSPSQWRARAQALGGQGSRDTPAPPAAA